MYSNLYFNKVTYLSEGNEIPTVCKGFHLNQLNNLLFIVRFKRPFGIREGQKARIMERAESVKMAGEVIIRLAFVRGERF